MGRYGQLAKNTVLIGIGSFSSKLLTFLCVPLYTALLTTEQYGLADIITTTSLLVFQVLTLTICEGLLRYCLEEDSDKAGIFTISVLITFVGFAILAAIAPFAGNIEAIAECYPLFMAYYIGYAIYATVSYFARGIEAIAAYSFCGVLNTALTIALNIVFLVIFDLGLAGYIFAYAISFALSSVALFIAVKGWRYLQPRKIKGTLVRELVSYSAPMIPNSISWWISNSAGLYSVMLFCGVSASGIYSAAQKIPAIVYALCGIFMTAWRISAVKGFGSFESKNFYAHILQGLIAFASTLTAALIVLVQPIASLMYASDFQEAWRYVPLLTIAVYFHSMDEFMGSVYTSAMKTKMLFFSAAIGAVVNIGLCCLLVPFYGIDGAAISALASYVFIYVVRDAHTTKFFAFPRYRREQVCCTILLVISALSMTHLSSVGIFVSAAALFTIAFLNRKAFCLVLSVVGSKLLSQLSGGRKTKR